MYEVLIAHLRECAKLDPSNNTYAEAADAIEKLGDWWAGADKLIKMLEMPQPPKEKPTCEDCQRECQMMGLAMEACASYEPPEEE